MPEVWPLFKHLPSAPEAISEVDMALIERFVIVLYTRASSDVYVNVARKRMFTHRNRQIDNIPPPRSAILQLSGRSHMEANIVSPSHCGWVKSAERHWVSRWSLLSEVCHLQQDHIEAVKYAF